MQLYPYDVPEGAHPLAWTLYGHGLDSATINRLCRHLYDNLGVRLHLPEPRDVTMGWAVDWALDPGDRDIAHVGHKLDIGLGFDTAVTIIDGALPPGIRLEAHTGRLAGVFKQAGLYRATFRLAPRIKYDPLGGPGGPDTAGKWIPLDQPRYTPPAADPAPARDLSAMTPQELEALIVKAQQAQRAGLIRDADKEPSGGD